ncbi:hemerythrin domain-containing protein [Spirillospora sp. NPDC047279]|uniref:hemerythrin domain-containing protein n=1 Tax=Spirillospora sp. NPDC047279 TaxID=3155478 RepID=UPI00340527D2
MSTPPTGDDATGNERLEAFGDQLIEVHDWLREELARLQDGVGAYLDGTGARPRELRAHCLTFCSALERHHTGEDGTAFPALAERFPELRPVIEKLVQDHDLISGILHRIEELVGGLEAARELGEAEAAKVRGELDGLAAIMESHFTFEERQIVAALNDLRDPGWTSSPPGFLLGGEQR